MLVIFLFFHFNFTFDPVNEVPDRVIDVVRESGVLLRSPTSGVLRPLWSGVLRPSWGENLGIRDFFSIWFGVDERVNGEGALLLPAALRLGCGGGVPTFLRPGGGVLLPPTSFLTVLASRLDMDLWGR